MIKVKKGKGIVACCQLILVAVVLFLTLAGSWYALIRDVSIGPHAIPIDVFEYRTQLDEPDRDAFKRRDSEPDVETVIKTLWLATRSNASCAFAARSSSSDVSFSPGPRASAAHVAATVGL